MIDQMMGSNRTVTLMRNWQVKRSHQVAARNDMNIGLSSDKWERRGQIAGTLVSDIVQDRGRQFGGSLMPHRQQEMSLTILH